MKARQGNTGGSNTATDRPDRDSRRNANFRLKPGGSRLEYLVRIRTGSYRLGSDISSTSEQALLLLSLAMGLQSRFDDPGGIARSAPVDQAEGDTLDTFSPVGGNKKITQQGSTHRDRQDQCRKHQQSAAERRKSVKFVRQIV